MISWIMTLPALLIFVKEKDEGVQYMSNANQKVLLRLYNAVGH